MSTVEGEDLRGTHYVDCQLDGAEFREVTLVGARFIGSVMIDVEIDALVRNLTVELDAALTYARGRSTSTTST